MQTILNLNFHCGPPLCVSGITLGVSFYKEIEDHDLRRKTMKKQRSQIQNTDQRINGDQEMGILEMIQTLFNDHDDDHQEINTTTTTTVIKEKDDEINNDGFAESSCLPCIAKAA